MPREPKSSRCSVLEITPGRAGTAQVALQPLGQPGAARPDADQHRARAAAGRARRPAARRTALRHRGCSMLHSWQARCRNCSRISAADAASTSARALRPAPRWWCSARRPRAPAGRKRPCNWRAKRCARARVVVRGAVGMEGHADHQRGGLPLAHQRGDGSKARARPAPPRVVSGCAVRSSVLPLATPTRRVPKSKARKADAEREIAAERRSGRAAAAHACPASWLTACAGRSRAATAHVS